MKEKEQESTTDHSKDKLRRCGIRRRYSAGGSIFNSKYNKSKRGFVAQEQIEGSVNAKLLNGDMKRESC